jgi:hypothetical protein
LKMRKHISSALAFWKHNFCPMSATIRGVAAICCNRLSITIDIHLLDPGVDRSMAEPEECRLSVAR